MPPGATPDQGRARLPASGVAPNTFERKGHGYVAEAMVCSPPTEAGFVVFRDLCGGVWAIGSAGGCARTDDGQRHERGDDGGGDGLPDHTDRRSWEAGAAQGGAAAD